MNLKRAILSGFAVISCLLTFAQTSKDTVLFTIDNDTVTLSEFRYIYEKNNSSDKGLYSEANLKEYLDLYVNFKLKVKEAKEQGLDTTEKFLNEFNTYRNQLAQPYLTDREVTTKLVDEAYERSKWEIRASHILIPVSPDASPKDTLKAYNEIVGLRNRILKGENFEKLARDFSKDPSVDHNGGDLGYFTVFQMIYPFETGAFNLKDTGEISQPIRTRYGYHIIKLTDRRQYRGDIRVRHILINSSPNDEPEKQKIARNKVDSLYSLLQKGANFAELARQYSDHQQSRPNGGELQPFNSFAQNLPDDFKNAAFDLKEDGEFTKPFKTNYGWHIIQRISMEPIPEREKMEEYLKQRISKDMRSEKSLEAAISRFKKQYKYKQDKKALKRFIKYTDSTLLSGTWKPGNVDLSKTIFTLDGSKYTQKDFADYLLQNQQPNRFSDLKYALDKYFKDFTDRTIYKYHDANLEKEYPEFRNVAKEYKEGILLFDITDKNVWSKAMQDTIGQKEYFEANKEKYMWKERAEASIFDLRDKSAVSDIKSKLTKENNPQKIADGYAEKDPLSVNYKEGLFERGENNILDTLQWKPGIYDLGPINGRYYVIKIHKILPPDYKKFEEIKGNVIADYQDYLEKEWLNALKKKYKVKINQQVVDNLIIK